MEKMVRRIDPHLKLLQKYINELEDVYDNEQMNEWEEGFFQSIKGQDPSDLSDTQVAKLEEIYDKYCE
jgi:hypothetical protein